MCMYSTPAPASRRLKSPRVGPCVLAPSHAASLPDIDQNVDPGLIEGLEKAPLIEAYTPIVAMLPATSTELIKP